jgi:hypothetical protein
MESMTINAWMAQEAMQMTWPHMEFSNWYNLAGQVSSGAAADPGRRSSTIIALLGDGFSR